MRVRFQGPIQRTVLEQHWASQAEIDAAFADLDAWSEQPDAFVAFALCWGLGWAP
jgi:hypothetical protein